MSLSAPESEVPRQLEIVILSLKQKFITRLEAPMPTEPNQAPEPTSTLVTGPAGAGPAPSALVAHL